MSYANDVTAKNGRAGDSLGSNPLRLAIEDRLQGSYKAIALHNPQAIKAYSLFLSELHDGLSGRVRGICLAGGLGEQGAKRVAEGLAGDRGISAMSMMVLMDAAPGVFFAAVGVLASRYGHQLVPLPRPPAAVDASGVAADLAKDGGSLNAALFLALSHGVIEGEQARAVLAAIEKFQRELGEIKALALKGVTR